MKIVILGLPGAGKTALGKKVARRYGIRPIEADVIFWNEPGAPSVVRRDPADIGMRP